MPLRQGEKYIELTLSIWEEDGRFAARCGELGTASCGDTLDEARENILDAVRIHLDTLEDLGELQDFLQRRDVKVPTFREAAEAPEYASQAKRGRVDFTSTRADQSKLASPNAVRCSSNVDRD